MAEQWSKHKHDLLNHPDQNELSKHCHHNHNLEKNLEITILDYGYDCLEGREQMEDIYVHLQNAITTVQQMWHEQ